MHHNPAPPSLSLADTDTILGSSNDGAISDNAAALARRRRRRRMSPGKVCLIRM